MVGLTQISPALCYFFGNNPHCYQGKHSNNGQQNASRKPTSRALKATEITCLTVASGIQRKSAPNGGGGI